jgi:hypothetical protein
MVASIYEGKTWLYAFFSLNTCSKSDRTIVPPVITWRGCDILLVVVDTTTMTCLSSSIPKTSICFTPLVSHVLSPSVGTICRVVRYVIDNQLGWMVTLKLLKWIFDTTKVRCVCGNECVYCKVTQYLLGNPTSVRSWGSQCPIISWMIGCTNGTFKGCPFAQIHLRTSHISSWSCGCFPIIVKWLFSNKGCCSLINGLSKCLFKNSSWCKLLSQWLTRKLVI